MNNEENVNDSVESQEEEIPRITPDATSDSEVAAPKKRGPKPKVAAPVEEASEERLEAPTPTPLVEINEDYLQKYQYRKQTAFGSVESNPPGGKALTMKRFLLGQKKVSIYIPRGHKEDPSIKQSVTLNGYRLDIPKNIYIEVPEQIAVVIMDSLNQTNAAIMRGQIVD